MPGSANKSKSAAARNEYAGNDLPGAD
jgi:hypothetical protein